jgi:2-polyprenyl-3-methyl-5-hydroxy-6-metoxy-1,4-benzoquinol methylase
LRRRGVEILDDPTVDPVVRVRSTRDIVWSNRWLGGQRAAVRAIGDIIGGLAPRATLVDIGTGLADIPVGATTVAQDAGVALTTIGVDGAAALLAAARGRVTHVVCADARALPFRDGSMDVVMCSQVLHHFDMGEAERVARELTRVARRFVIVSDLRRSWLAAMGFWIVSVLFGFHRVTRHDGVLSVLRGFTPGELRTLVVRATGVVPTVARRLGYRLTARWSPRGLDMKRS